ncbi:MAG: Aspartyl/glutamyl-tRNA(Asn/Gln) amidotransferase subunit B [Chlamydiae bacterium]|nr:Aspartyl/glutamyl-tRNA(Asn/Gln) amidotransferase subunit B [Chlamydiota bacterium]
MNNSEWETVVGIEVHAQLNTVSKLFSSAPNSFGDEPNTNISVVCTGQPGTLPVLNKEAVKKAVLWGHAVNAEVALYSKFDRKSYFYPDAPRNFQITQFDKPIVKGGKVTCEIDGKEKTLELDHTHLEDDAGNCRHFSNFGGVDYNRAGVPLIEIVTKPLVGTTPKEVATFASMIRAILQYLDICDCNMEEGSLRMDCNVSVKKKTEKEFRTKVEIKNMNSFSNMQLAIEQEVNRQTKIYMSNPEADPKSLIMQSTYRWDPEAKMIRLMRLKEHADDYRYFPEPDLPPLLLTQEYIDALQQEMPELPFERKKRYMEHIKIAEDITNILINDKKLSDYFERALKVCSNARSLSNWIVVEFLGRFKDSGVNLPDSEIEAENIGRLVNMIDKKIINGKIAKKVADDMVSMSGKDCEEIVSENPDYQPVNDESEIEALVDQVLAQNQQSITDYKNGKEKAFGFLVGQVMKLSRGKASPELVNKLLKKKL